ncbi:hypothetical protein [Tuwongella immobilis]|uniref:Uncharacterized protein n=1 Tax=Tuwongella immobilis TaxID=692036 RepID=A0A6C2YT16_9BACT|nr:hypothetical protein [Tuwongella immobilis]VIP04878.1 Uncharacterized protein OS=Singulisphaera acidiphila (strain ATCC BAA-1392 / DSM 18658 / VKM B-2454 / MOB10) GN=Sinac_0935 PE=4 SV=1 [Tuwongella immobilis]VTS07115.1 Uncharacterized protein OS=Singulisphaera acidiphila (strain ATCC BAA-1392 / DSM 18658 / VKM B-2454 / MOB10) GN=Sinac_0935 PE=4 SV=1 [Tuwongella immobilis]
MSRWLWSGCVLLGLQIAVVAQSADPAPSPQPPAQEKADPAAKPMPKQAPSPKAVPKQPKQPAPKTFLLPESKTQPAPETRNPGLTREVVISPKALPVPALRYQLANRFADRIPGNATTTYLRVFASEFWPRQYRDPKFVQKTLEWDTLPLDKFGTPEIREYVAAHRNMIKEMDIAARKERFDWELDQRLEQETFTLLLPDLQQFRELARINQYRVRLAIHDKRYDEALLGLRTGFSMGRQVGSGPTLIHGLVGIAITMVMSQNLDELLAQPDAPNLYWALAELPRPLVDPRSAFQGEFRMVDRYLGDLSLVEGKKLTAAEANQLLNQEMQRFTNNLNVINPASKSEPIMGDMSAPFAQAAYVAVALASSKQFLLEQGISTDQLKDMPASQVVMWATMLQARQIRDDMFKWVMLPYPQAILGIQQAEKKLREMSISTTNIPAVFLRLLLPSLEKVHFAFSRADRRIAQQMIVEAIRHHMTTNGGKLPQSLDEIAELPIPNDPVTGKPFRYALRGDQAILGELDAKDLAFSGVFVYVIRAKK